MQDTEYCVAEVRVGAEVGRVGELTGGTTRPVAADIVVQIAAIQSGAAPRRAGHGFALWRERDDRGVELGGRIEPCEDATALWCGVPEQRAAHQLSLIHISEPTRL